MIELYPLDAGGNPAATVNGIPVVGPLLGWSGLTFSPSAATIDQVAQYTVMVPLSEWRNIAVAPGTQLMVWDTDLADEVSRGAVLDMTQTVDDQGIHWAQVTFMDALYDLSRATVTSGFASSPGEAMALTLTRLTGPALVDTAWTAVCDVTGFDGVAFSAFRQSVAQAVGKLATERPGAHFRREYAGGNPRILHMGAFGTPFLVGADRLWLTAPAPNPTTAEEAPAQRQMFGVQFARKGAITNSLTPSGGGNGPSELSLRTLYGDTSFQGFNPLRPVKRRPRQDGGAGVPSGSGGFAGQGSFDGFDYYLDDAASIALYGRSWGDLSKPDINPVVTPTGGVAAADERAAAIALYVVADASMKWSVAPTMQLTFTTAGRGDLRNIGGQTVHITYRDWAFDTQQEVYSIIDVDGEFTVLSLMRAVREDGTAQDTWTVSDTGQYAQTHDGVLIGQLNQITALGASITTYPHRYTIPKSGSVDAGTPLTLRIRPDNSIVRHHYALLTLSFEGIRHTVTDNGHTQDVVTAPMNSDVNAIPHDVNALTSTEYEVGGATPVNGPVLYSPSVKFDINPNPPGGAVAVMYDPVGRFFYYAGTNHGMQEVDLPSQALTINQINPTTGGKGGTVAKTTGAADIAAGSKTPGTVGGTVPGATHAATDPATGKPTGLGAVLTKATVERMSIGPLPTGVSVVIDGATRFTGVANGATLDLLPYVGDQAGHTVEIHAATIGGVDCQLDISVDITTTALTPLGN